MRPANAVPHPPQQPSGAPGYDTPRGWTELSREERRRQIRELMSSRYWKILPRDIRERFVDLYGTC